MRLGRERGYYCPMRLHQLKVDYEAEQDRLLMLVATSDGVARAAVVTGYALV